MKKIKQEDLLIKNDTYRSLKNLFLLPGGVVIIAFLTWLFYLYIEGSDHSNSNPDTSAAEGFGMAMLLFLFVGLLVMLFVIWWTTRIVSDIVKNRRNKIFVLSNISILLIVYGPLFLLGYSEMSFLMQRVSYINEQQKNVINIDYKTIGLSNNEVVFAYHNKKDSLFIFINHYSKAQQSYRKLFPVPSYPCSQLWLEDLRIFYVKGDQLIPINNYDLDTTSEHSAGRNIYLKIPVRDNQSDVVSKFLYNEKTTELFIKNASRDGRLDTVRGFNLEDKFHSIQFKSQSSYVDDDKNLWFYFYTDEKNTSNKHSYLYIAMIGNNEQKFYKINFKEGENDFFEGDRKLFMTKVKGVFYLIASQKIISFRIH